MPVCIFFMHSYTIRLIFLKFFVCLIGSVDVSQFDQIVSTKGGAQNRYFKIYNLNFIYSLIHINL